jgi:hypothetical protein
MNMQLPAREPVQVEMPTIVAELESIVHFRLFGPVRWLAEGEIADALHKKILKMGLREKVFGTSDAWQATPLGAVVNVEVYEVFIGLFDEVEIPNLLCHHGLMDETLVDDIYARIENGKGAETLLRGYVKRAYFDYHKATKYLN